MDKQLYLKGEESLIFEVLEFAKERLGKGKIWLVDMEPNVIPDDKCSCGGNYYFTCEHCGDEYTKNNEVQKK